MEENFRIHNWTSRFGRKKQKTFYQNEKIPRKKRQKQQLVPIL